MLDALLASHHLILHFPLSAAHGLGFWTERSAVHEAAAEGRVLQLQQLIQAGAAVNIVAVDSITPLHEACIQGQTQCVRLLLDAGAKVRLHQNIISDTGSLSVRYLNFE